MREKLVLLVRWLAACAGGAGLAALSFAIGPFLGYLVLFGGLLGTVQVFVVGPLGLNAAGRWILGSFAGWAVGSMLGASFTGGPLGGVAWGFSWLGLGVGQLLGLLHRRRERALGDAVSWVLVSTVAGGLSSGVLMWVNTTAMYASLEGLLGGFGTLVAGQTVVVAVVYGLPAGAALLWITSRQGVPPKQHT